MASKEKFSKEKIYSKIVNEDFDKLSTTFLSTGRGRRPNLPQLKTTCRLLLQLYYCKNDKSWDELTGFAQKIINLSKERLRYVIETTFKRACALIDGEEEHFTLFLEEELAFIGIQLKSAGVTREQLLNVPVPVPVPIGLTNGILIELDKFRKDEDLSSSWMHEAVQALTGNIQCDRKTLTKDLTKILCEFKKKSKNKSRDRCQLENFLLVDYVCPKQVSVLETLVQDINGDVCQVSVQESVVDNPKKRFRENSAISCDTPHTEAVKLRKLRGDIEALEKSLTAEKATGHTLQQLVEEKNVKIASLTERKDVEICELLASKHKIQASLDETKKTTE
ncbi:uncharacterized protein LOC121376400 [Gigantopelta aegis]|uniref:uncharacterized protein LOC121376400 n=1 Tax=Gigantopelta aegis TaxID=1735272 RepID=UPI001B887C76|nr:uncharacterized protein LOC121376400 [Gigantopelta aegis]